MTLKPKAAFVDLDTQAVQIKEIPHRLTELYLGGRGIDMYLLYNLMDPGIDAMDPRNVFMISAGLLTATPAPSSNHIYIGGKSPVTNLAGSCKTAGFFGSEFRFAGLDHIVIRGKANSPVYLWVHNGGIQIRDASLLWGKDTSETKLSIREDLGDEDVQVIAIGSDGENLNRIANIHTNIKPSDGCKGMGALMGTKRLKAMAVRGTLPINIADSRKALLYLKQVIDFTNPSNDTKNNLPDELLEKSFGQKGCTSDDHRKAWFSFRQECISSLADALGLEKLPTVSLSTNDNPISKAYSLLLEAITGLHFAFEELITVGERIYNIERLFNIREGLTRENDTVLDRAFPESKLAASRTNVIGQKKFEYLLDICYEIRGWNRKGRPKPQTLKRLGLDREPSHMF